MEREADELTPRQLAVRWNAPLWVVCLIALGRHSWVCYTGFFHSLRRESGVVFDLGEVMRLERIFAAGLVSLPQAIDRPR